VNIVSFTYSGKALADCMVAKIYRLEAALLELPQVDCPTVDRFRPGEWEREMTIPPWTALTGAVHTTRHLVRIVSGAIEVMTADGLALVCAPCEFWSEPGIKRAGRTFAEGCVFVNVFSNPDDCQDLDILVERVSTSKNSELLGNRPALKNEVESWLLG
jgi:hypothetical protein